jgi:alkanesulfonate monooxygenase SsuD/methylene tetrahydromethanopterin reductase-like flavin-dependent oxidoreductase (luciferase family)
MKFGLFMGIWENPKADGNQHRILNQVIDYVVRAESLGFISVFLTEHHFTGLPQIPSSLTVLSYLAARTTTLRLGTALIILPWHNPLLLAEQIGTLDLLSNGRFDCGVGQGFRYVECRGFGIPGEELSDRFDEGLEILMKAWSASGRFSHHGRFWNFDDAIIDPRPLQRPHPPIWIGAASERSLQRIADQGHNLLMDQFSDSSQIGARLAFFKQRVLAAGGTFDPMSVGVTRAFHLTSSEAETRDALEHHLHVLANNRKLSTNPNESGSAVHRPPVASGNADETWLIGTPDQIVRRLNSLKAHGVEYVLLIDTMGDSANLQRFATEVMPQFDTPGASEAA